MGKERVPNQNPGPEQDYCTDANYERKSLAFHVWGTMRAMQGRCSVFIIQLYPANNFEGFSPGLVRGDTGSKEPGFSSYLIKLYDPGPQFGVNNAGGVPVLAYVFDLNYLVVRHRSEYTSRARACSNKSH